MSALRDYLPGLVVIAAGLFVAAIAATYPLGSAFRPGPGFFPLGIGLLLAGLGLAVMVERYALGAAAPSADEEDDSGPMAWRPVAATSVGILVFAVLLEPLGYIPAAILLVLIAALGERQKNWARVAGIAVFMAVFGTVVFIWGLGLPLDPIAGLG